MRHGVRLPERLKLLLHLFVGVILVVYSSAAFLAHVGIASASAFFSYILMALLLLTFGVFIVYDNIKRPQALRSVNFIVGIFLSFFGAFPLLVDLNLLGFLPYTLEFSVNVILLSVLLFFSSIYFVVDKFFAIFQKDYA